LFLSLHVLLTRSNFPVDEDPLRIHRVLVAASQRRVTRTTPGVLQRTKSFLWAGSWQAV